MDDGYGAHPYGSDPEDTFLDTAWWVGQKLLPGAETALLRTSAAYGAARPDGQCGGIPRCRRRAAARR